MTDTSGLCDYGADGGDDEIDAYLDRVDEIDAHLQRMKDDTFVPHPSLMEDQP